jgi:mitochondrial import inner membrane translocase subunit TIM54
LDWEFIQGRKEGDVRAELAERIRNHRAPAEETLAEEDTTMRIRRQNGVKEFDGPQGDIVIGRHTWKEYVRGLHEGWLGPLKPPSSPEAEKATEEPQSAESVKSKEPTEIFPETPTEALPANKDSSPAGDNATPDSTPEKSKKPPQPPPFISTSAYQSASTPPNIPSCFDPSVPISFPHILGFVNTPLRLHRFLNRRHLADAIGRETAAIVLSNYRSYYTTAPAPSSSFSSPFGDSPGVVADDPRFSEQATVLAEEEKDWHKAIHKHTENEPERTWLEDMVLDPRIAGRMRRAELSQEDEERAKQIIVPEEEIEGWIKGSLRGLWRSGNAYIGFERDKKKPLDDFGEGNVE